MIKSIKRILSALLILLFIGVQSLAQQLNQSVGKLNSFEKTAYGLKGKTDLASFEVITYSPNIIRIKLEKAGTRHDDFTYAVVAEPTVTNHKFNESDSKIEIVTDSLKLVITKNPVRFSLQTPDGRVINEDDQGFGTSWIGEEASTYKKLQKGERFVGLGEKTGNLDRAGEGYTNYNTDYFAYPTNGDPLYVSTPFYMGFHNGLQYGLFMDNSYKSHFNFGASNDRFSSFTAEDGPMDYYLIYHTRVKDIIKSYTHLTGRMDMPPKWSLGYQQCRYSYYPDSDVLNVARTFREKEIPADVIYLDIHYMDAYKIFTWHPDRFPDPDGMLKELRDMGFHVVIIVDPGIKVEEGYESYEEGLEKELFVKYPDGTNYTGQVWPGWCHFPDFTNPDARKWWGHSFKGYVDNGIDGFWNDMNEIATWGQRLPELMEFDFDGHKSTTRRARNVYGMQMSRATYEGTKDLLKGKRPFILTRAGFSGVQRYSAVWTGDNIPEDDHMLLGVRLVNSLGLTGIAYAGPDVGGFAGDPSIELYARWIGIGAFTPFFRGHTMVNSRSSEPWSYGEEVEEIARNYISLRYQLMPYIYSYFYESTQNGMPVSRSLAIDYTHDPLVYDTRFQNQYLFGNSFLVAPVESTKALEKVFLPAGNDWYDIHSGKRLKGGQIIVAESPINQLPVYIRSGAIIPMQSAVQHMEQDHDGELKIHVYNGDKGSSFYYYEDDGDTYAFENGSYFKRKIQFDPKKKSITFDDAEGQFASTYKSIKVVFIGFDDISGRMSVNKSKSKVNRENIAYFKPISKFDPIGDEGVVEGVNAQTITLNHSTSEIVIQW